MRILLPGTTGKVGAYLAHHFKDTCEILSLTRQQVDLRETAALRQFLAAHRYDLILNSAALSTPEACEADPETARLVNVEAPRAMAEACATSGTRLIHLSTDYVLDGNLPGLKDETAATGPNNTYGHTKLAGEIAALDANPRTTIARISWVFGSAGEGFLEKVFRQIRNNLPLEAVADKYSMPTSAKDLAAALELLIRQPTSGVYHLTQTADEPVSWHSYAGEVALAAHELGLTTRLQTVTPRSMKEIPALRTNRPVHTSLKPQKLLDEFNYSPRHWKTALRERVKVLAARV